MARPLKLGLDYFPLDTDIDSDDKIQLIEAEFGSKGFAVVIKLLCKVYSDKGYYYNWTEVEKLLFAKKMGESVSLVDEIVKRSVKWGLFEKSVFNQFQVLTSSAIQSRFLEAVNRREKVEMFKEFSLIDVSKYRNVVNVYINRVNVNIGTQSKVKEIKVKEINDAIPSDDEKENPEISIEKDPETSPKKRNDKVEKLDFQLLLEYLNEKKGRNYRVVPDKVKTKFHSLLKQGYEKKDIKTAIDNAVKAKNHIENNFQYLTMEFFSRTEKIDMYSNTGKSETVKSKNNKPLGVWSV